MIPVWVYEKSKKAGWFHKLFTEPNQENRANILCNLAMASSKSDRIDYSYDQVRSLMLEDDIQTDQLRTINIRVFEATPQSTCLLS